MNARDLYVDGPDFQDFLRRYCEEELGEFWQRYPSKKTIKISYQDLVAWNHEMADVLMGEHDGTSYQALMGALEHAVSDLDNPVDCNPDPDAISIQFVEFGEEERDVGEYWAEDDLGKYRAIYGQVENQTQPRPDYDVIVYECKKCGVHTEVPQSDDAEIATPYQCEGCTREGPFKRLPDESEGSEHQKLRLKLPVEERQGETSPHIDVDLEGRIVRDADRLGVQSGTRVTVAGVLTTPPDEEKWLLEANSIQVDDDDIQNYQPDPDERDEIEALANGEHGDPYNLVVESTAPSLKGTKEIEEVTYQGETKPKMWWLKLSAALCGLFQSWRRPNGDGTYQRGVSHWFGIGDPSTGKSTILNTIEEISPRAAFVSGKNASAAGLTAAAVNNDFDGSNWTLEAGALVQGHGGVACIDELDKAKDDAVSSLHGALEKQRVEVSKAGISATLPCETSLLAAGNPKDSRWNQYGEQSTVEQMDVVASLLDRFDVIWTLYDTQDEHRDEVIGEHAVETRIQSGKRARGDAEEDAAAQPAVSEDMYRKWVALSRDVKPVIEDDAVKDRIVDYYVDVRAESAKEDNPLPATTRTVEGIMRLAEAAAKVELSESVEMHHAELAIGIMEASLLDVGYDSEAGAVDVDMAGGRGSWTQRDRMDKIRGLIDEFSDEEPASVENVVETAVSAGIDYDKAQHAIEKLQDQREVYSPQDGGLRLV